MRICDLKVFNDNQKREEFMKAGKEKNKNTRIPLLKVSDLFVLIKYLFKLLCGDNVAVFMHGPNTGHK